MKIFGMIAVFLAFLLFGCADRSTQSSANKDVSFGIYDIAASEQNTVANSPVAASNSGSGSGTGGGGGGREVIAVLVTQNATLAQAQQSQSQSDRKIIRNAELNLESDSPEESQKKITSLAETKGGFVVESQQSSSDVRSTTRDVVTMTVRIPSEKFAEAIDEIRKAASRVVVETVKGQDVTEEFIDIEADLKAKKALEMQFMEIMKRANTVEEALDVQRQLAGVRGEIEKIEGRKRFLENQASLSTIKIRIQTPAAIASSSAGFGYRLTDSFGSGMDIALNFILGLITFVVAVVPFALFIGLPVFLVGRHFYRKQKQPMSVSDIAKEEIKSE